MVKNASLVLSVFFLVGAPLAAQDPPEDPPVQDAEIEEMLLPDEPPANFEAAELARSRECVPGLIELDAVAARLDPLRERAERLEALHQAVSVEDSVRVAPFAEDDPLEQAVREWFVADQELAQEYLDTGDEAIQERRREQRDRILERLAQVFEEVDREAAGIVESAEGLDQAVRDCEDRVLVRSAVLEGCEAVDGPVCEAARTEELSNRYRFVENASDLWDIEQFRPWSDPSGLRPTPAGGLGGARTAAEARRGNIRLVVSVETLIQPRDALGEEQAQEYDAHLETLGFEFDHPDFVMAPALAFELDVPGRLGDETHYLFHFGDLSDPEQDVIWAAAAPEEGPVGAFFAAQEPHLVRLAQGESVSVTAVRLPTDGQEAEEVEGEALFSFEITPVGQPQAVVALLQYMGGGQLSSDLAALIPPGELDGLPDPGDQPGAPGNR